MPKVALISNMPAPYRERVYELVAQEFNNDFHLIFCQKIEADRQWNNVNGAYPKHFLKEKVFSYQNYYERFVHYNPDVWQVLTQLNPDIVITYGYNPTYLFAYAWAKLKKKKHIVFSDTSFSIDKSLSFIHRVLRRIFAKTSHSFIAASNQAKDLLIGYGADEKKIFFSHLCADNKLFLNYKGVASRKYDLMFSGRFINSKSPLFFCEVALKVKKALGSLKVLLIGDGPLKDEMFDFLKKNEIDYDYPGFIKQQDLPKYYYQSKIFLFPTLIDCWGVVLNEACASGMAVISTEFTGAVGELVLHEQNGYVLPLEETLWSEKIIGLLMDDKKFELFSKRSIELVSLYSYENAAKGISQAITSASSE